MIQKSRTKPLLRPRLLPQLQPNRRMGPGPPHLLNWLRLEEAAAAAGNVFYFEFDSSTLTPEAVGAVDAHIAVLKLNNENVRLEGHTDERGTREYNIALGERRANSVRDYMVANGISSFRIETVSYGEEKPVAYGSGESNWAQNRRVELKPQ